MRRVKIVFGFLFLFTFSERTLSHCTTRPDGIRVALKGKTRAKYAIKALYMNGHIEFISFDLDEFALTEEQVLLRIENKKILRDKTKASYGDLHSVKLVYSPKSPENSTETFMVRACVDVPSYRLRSLVPVKAGQK